MLYELPLVAWFFTRYCLLVTEGKTYFVAWKKGDFRLIGEYVNDNQGLSDFNIFLKKNGAKYKNKTVNVAVSLVGEDYRFEKVAHLVGKYRTDMIKKKYAQLFRGTTYNTYEAQGREPIGRRLDMLLFAGVLSNEKLQPWVTEVTRAKMVLANVLPISMISKKLNKDIFSSNIGNNVVSYMVDEGYIRHCYYIDGNLRFSRLSRVEQEAKALEVYRSLRSEVDKTSQYLISTKVLQPSSKIHLYLVCPDDLKMEIEQVASRVDDRVRIVPVSAQTLCNSIGVKRPISEFGRDATPIIHALLRCIVNPLQTMAPLQLVRFHIAKSAASLIGVFFATWAIFNVLNHGSDALSGFTNYEFENDRIVADIVLRRNEYQRQIDLFEQPPSSSSNMRAVVNLLEGTFNTRFNPGKLMLFISRLLEENSSILLQSYDWYVVDEENQVSGWRSTVTGESLREVFSMTGELDINLDPEFSMSQFENFLGNIGNRPDMTVEIVERPSLIESDGNLVGKLSANADIRSELNAFAHNRYRIKIVWDPLNTEEQIESLASAN